MSHDYVFVLTTLPADGDPAALARTLVGERLAACVNIHSAMRSVYRWDDGVQEDTEHQLAIKTTGARVQALWERLRDLHPYDVPEFIVLPIIDGSDAYLKWIADSTTES